MSTLRSPECPPRGRVAGLALALALACTVHAQPDLRAARERIAQQRQAAQAAYEQREQACRQQFVVASCIEQARSQRRAALQHLDREQAAIDESMRQQKAAERLQRLADKQRAAAELRAAPPPQVTERKPKLPQRAGDAAAASEPAGTGAPRVSPLPARAREAEHRRRVLRAEQHRQAVEKRNAERAARDAGKKAAPLPMPSASDLSR